MKKSKLLNLILRGGGGGGTNNNSEDSNAIKGGSDPGFLDQLPPEPGVLVRQTPRQSPRRKNRDRPPPAVVPQLRQPVERSTSWKYTNDQSPETFTVNSSPSILDAIRTEQEKLSASEPQAVLIEKSQSWSGDRPLESATDSGSSRGGTNNNSRAGSASRASSRTGTLTAGRSSIRDRSIVTGGSRTGSRVGSDHGGDSTPSSIYDHDHYTTYTDADGYENVELSSPQRNDSGDNSSSHGSGSRLHGSRLSVKGSTRRSRRPSPRRSPLAGEINTIIDLNGVSRAGSVHGTVPSISLSTSSPLPIRPSQRASPQRSPSRSQQRSPHRSPNRTPSNRSPASHSPNRRSPSRSPTRHSPIIEIPRPSSRSSSHSPSRASSRMGSRRSSRSPNRSSRPTSSERWHERDDRGSPLNANNRSMSCEGEQQQQHLRGNLPRPLWKTRSWQQPRNQEIPVHQDRTALSKSISWQQQNVRPPNEVRRNPVSRSHSIITRQEALPAQLHVFTKSRSWQQSHEPEPVPEPLSRTYTVHERRAPRRSSSRLAPPQSRGSSVSPARSPMTAQTPQGNTRSGMYYPDERQSYPPQHISQLNQSSYASPVINTTNGPSDYVELRDYEILERQQSIRAAEQYRLEQQRQEHIRQEQYIREKLRTEKQKYQNDHHRYTQDQYVRRQLNAPFSQQLSFSHAYSQPNYSQTGGIQSQILLQRQRSGSQRNKTQSNIEEKVYHPPREFMNQNTLHDEYASLRDVLPKNVHREREPDHHDNHHDHHHAPPIKSASLMSSVELLNTLKRQLALSSPSKTGRSKSVEAGRAAAEMASNDSINDEHTELSSITIGSSLPTGRLSPALQALVAEKRARLKRSTVAFSGSGGRMRFGILRTIASPATRCTVDLLSFAFPRTTPSLLLSHFHPSPPIIS